jgi:hypothetical protein
MKDDPLVIQNWPSCFEEFAWKHNRLVYLIREMQGVNGITVAVADANIIIGTSGGTGSGGSITYTAVSLTACINGTATATTFITSVGLI